jgi:hypothetical protein
MAGRRLGIHPLLELIATVVRESIREGVWRG